MTEIMFVLNSQSLERNLAIDYVGLLGGMRERDGEQIGVQRRVRKVWYGIVLEKKGIEEDNGGHVYGVTPMSEEFSAAPLHMVL